MWCCQNIYLQGSISVSPNTITQVKDVYNIHTHRLECEWEIHTATTHTHTQRETYRETICLMSLGGFISGALRYQASVCMDKSSVSQALVQQTHSSHHHELHHVMLLRCYSPSKLLNWPLRETCKVRPDSFTWVSNSRRLRFRRFSSIPDVQQV